MACIPKQNLLIVGWISLIETGYISLHPAKKVKDKIKRGWAYYYY
jgi:hypothetical protein